MDEWERWISLLSQNGLKCLILWPGFEFIDKKIDREAEEWLMVLSQVIDKCKTKSIEIYLGRSPNGYIEASSKKLNKRNQHDLSYCDPCSEDYIKHILYPQEKIFNKLPAFDGWWIIDSDPADSLGLGEDHFSKCFEHYRSILPPETKLVYWMWGGWTVLKNQEEGWRSSKQSFWEKAALKVLECEPEVEFWHCWPGHQKSIPKCSNKKTFFPYHKLEPEPSIPFLYHPNEWDHSITDESIDESDVILNVQSPCMRMPRLLEYLSTGCFFNEQTTIASIKKYWCWDSESLEELCLNLNRLGQNEIFERLSTEAIDQWKKYTKIGDVVKRGYLMEANARE